jgi:hypothetical protein
MRGNTWPISRIEFAKRKLVVNFWIVAVGSFVGVLLSVSFFMLVKAEIFYGVADSWGLAHGTLNMAANILGLAGLVVGIPSMIVCLVGSILRKY